MTKFGLKTREPGGGGVPPYKSDGGARRTF